MNWIRAGSLETLYSCIDRQNFIDFDLYYNAIAGMDNRFKNIIYSTVMNEDGTYTIRRIPWDQNYSWGDDFEQGEDKDIKNIRFNPELKTKWLNEDVFRNMQALDDTLPEICSVHGKDGVKFSDRRTVESICTRSR